jgi:hypothetical protein
MIEIFKHTISGKLNRLFLLEIKIKMVKKMGSEFKNGKMVVFIKEILLIMGLKVGEYFFILMVIFIKENLQKLLLMDMENLFMKIMQYIMDIG